MSMGVTMNDGSSLFQHRELVIIKATWYFSASKPLSAALYTVTLNPSAWGHLNPSSYCEVGRLFYGVFKL
jgi:hypothetical protein